MRLKHRVGNFFLFLGVIGLLVFGASALTGNYDIPFFLIGALLFGLGLNFRMSKSAGPPREAEAPTAVARPAGKGGPGKPGGGGGPTRPAAPKQQGVVSTILKGPAQRKTAPRKK